MQYRPFGKLDWQVSALGFGAMRLPILDGDSTRIDEPEAARILRRAIEGGVNYVDTAYPYHGGHSEAFVGRVLQNGYRQRVRLATKMPVWLVKTPQDFDRLLDEQLARLQTDHIDFYLLHALNRKHWQTVHHLDVLKWAEQAVASGRIGSLGFSFHDSLEVFKEIIDAYDWPFCQIQYNYIDVENQAGTEGLQYAAARGTAVVVMEPLRGGNLVSPPPAVQAVWDSAPTRRAPVDWALSWLWNQPEVSLVLSGMSTFEQVEQNLELAGASAVNTFSREEHQLVHHARAEYNRLSPVPCTGCEYCQPCANDLKIPRLFELFNQGRMFNRLESAREEYARIPEAEKPVNCLSCGQCEPFCPQGIAIPEWMARIDSVLGQGKPYEDVLA